LGPGTWNLVVGVVGGPVPVDLVPGRKKSRNHIYSSVSLHLVLARVETCTRQWCCHKNGTADNSAPKTKLMFLEYIQIKESCFKTTSATSHCGSDSSFTIQWREISSWSSRYCTNLLTAREERVAEPGELGVPHHATIDLVWATLLQSK
jgi:hypothetical protein